MAFVQLSDGSSILLAAGRRRQRLAKIVHTWWMSSHDVRPPQKDPGQPPEPDENKANGKVSRALAWYLSLEDRWDQTARKQIDRGGVWVTEGVPRIRRRRYQRRVRNRLANFRSEWRHQKIDEKLEIASLGEEDARVRQVLRQYIVRESAFFSYNRILLIIGIMLLILPVASSAAFFSSFRDVGTIDIIIAGITYLFLIIAVVGFISGVRSEDLRWLFKTLGMFIFFALIVGCFVVALLTVRTAILIGLLAVPFAAIYIAVALLIYSLIYRVFGLDGRGVIDYLPVSHLAIFDLFELLSVIAPCKTNYMDARTRRQLLRHISRIRDLMASRTTSRHIPINHASHSFELVRGRSLQSFALAEETFAAILTCRSKAEYEGVIERLRSAIISLLDNDWDGFPAPVKVSSYSRFKDIGTRLFAPMFLLGIAIGLPYVPFIELSETARTTIQVALIVSAVLSIVPINEDARKQILSIFQTPPRQ